MPRPDKLYALIEREAMRLFKNPSALMLIGMLIAFSILLVLSRHDKKSKLVCWIVYPDQAATAPSEESQAAFIRKLSERATQSATIKVVPVSKVTQYRQQRVYPPNTCAIELLELPSESKASS